MLELGDSPFVDHISRIECGLRFNQDEVHFFVRNRAMLDAAWNDDEFALTHDSFDRGISYATCL